MHWYKTCRADFASLIQLVKDRDTFGRQELGDLLQYFYKCTLSHKQEYVFNLLCQIRTAVFAMENMTGLYQRK